MGVLFITIRVRLNEEGFTLRKDSRRSLSYTKPAMPRNATGINVHFMNMMVWVLSVSVQWAAGQFL
jgi:hypothetical protein